MSLVFMGLQSAEGPVKTSSENLQIFFVIASRGRLLQ